ncbi:MAG: Crp/Fnr family transcriptional regulator [Lacibacter sp.]
MEQYLRSFNLFSNDEIEKALQAASYRKIGKCGFLIREEQVCKHVWFVQSGLFRSFYTNTTGEVITYCFAFANTFITAYSSFLTQEKSVENIHALSDAEVYAIPRETILQLEQSSTNWLRFSKLIAEQEYMKMEQRVFLLQKENAENRYKDLLEKHPDYLQQIPLQHLASYLGITQRHLSRIRRAITI